jgi:hypothetical protein
MGCVRSCRFLGLATSAVLRALNPRVQVRLISRRRILFKLWQRGIHLVPRVCVRYPRIHFGINPARVIEARSSNPDNLRLRVGHDLNRRTAVRAKAPPGHTAPLAGRGIEAQGALHKLESLRRHDDVRRKRTPTGSLAISTMTVKHHHRFGCGFIANRAASASA